MAYQQEMHKKDTGIRYSIVFDADFQIPTSFINDALSVFADYLSYLGFRINVVEFHEVVDPFSQETTLIDSDEEMDGILSKIVFIDEFDIMLQEEESAMNKLFYCNERL